MRHSLRYDINLSLLFTELPLLDRPAAAAAAGFDAVEFWWPFATARPGRREIDAFVASLALAGVRLAALNLYAGDMAAGERGVLSHPGRSDDFRASVDIACEIGRATGCRVFNALYGNRVPGADDDLALRNLAHAARTATGATIVLEPLHRGENPDYPLRTAAEAIRVCDRVRAISGRTTVKLLMDLYHLASNGEDLPAVIDAYAGRTGHVQIADAPGRRRPGTGSLDLEGLLARLERNGYRGGVGLEYRPDGGTEASLEWLPRARRAATVGPRGAS